MPIIIILGILLVWFVIDVYYILTKSKHKFTHEELEQISREMCGKSKGECSKILRKYRGK